jgi:hypothetical protein
VVDVVETLVGSHLQLCLAASLECPCLGLGLGLTMRHRGLPGVGCYPMFGYLGTRIRSPHPYRGQYQGNGDGRQEA